MLPGFSVELMPKGGEKEYQAKIKRYMTMIDSMTNEATSEIWRHELHFTPKGQNAIPKEMTSRQTMTKKQTSWEDCRKGCLLKNHFQLLYVVHLQPLIWPSERQGLDSSSSKMSLL